MTKLDASGIEFDAFWLPAIRTLSTTSRSLMALERTDRSLRIPVLNRPLLKQQIESLLRAREEVLAERPVRSIVTVVDRVAARLLDRGDPLRRTACDLLPVATGLSSEMVSMVLDRMAADWRAERLERLLAEEFDDPAVLDGPADLAGGRRVYAIGPKLAVHIFSGNVPGVAVTSMIRSLLVKSATFGKTASGEPVLAPLFARGIAEDDAELGACIAIAYWPGGDQELEAEVLRSAEAVIAYGSAEAVASLRERTPAGTRFLGYGNRLSFGVVAREALTDEGGEDLAKAAALAVATFDQQGCVSPHLIYVEAGGEVEPRIWARQLAAGIATIEDRLPRGKITEVDAAAIHQARGEAEFARLAGGDHEVHASAEGTAWTVIFDPDTRFAASCLNRTIRVVPVSSVEQVIERLRSLGDVLQTMGVAGPEDRLRPLAIAAARLGVTRITPLVRMPWPPPSWHHDGRPPLADLVRWCDWE